jgi:hypothetical protein
MIDALWSLVAAIVIAGLAYFISSARLISGVVEKITTAAAFEYGLRRTGSRPTTTDGWA